MNIREFTPNDLKEVFRIEHDCFELSYGLKIFRQLYNIGTGFLVAESQGIIVGYIIFWIKIEGQGHIISLAVDKNHRREGVATKLLSNAVGIFNKCNINKITLEVNVNNEDAIKFYKKAGFKLDRRVPNYYDNPDGSYEDAFVLYID